jgi:hypothetical protein
MPLFILAHVMAALCVARAGDNRRRPLDDLLDPSLSNPNRLRAVLEGSSLTSGGGIALDWFEAPIHPTTACRCLAVAEFLMTADDEHYFEITGSLDRIAAAPGEPAVRDAGRRLARIAHAWRQKHVPLAPIERQLRKVATFLASREARSAPLAPSDGDILGYFASQTEAGARPVLRNVVELFLTVQRALTHLRFQPRADNSLSIDDITVAQEARARLLGDICAEDRETVEHALLAIPEAPKMLTGAERATLRSLLSLEPFTERLPLTVLRTLAFGEVQSGILNRIRRGSGGASVEERVACRDAEPYVDLAKSARALGDHLTALMRIAYAVRVGTDGEAEGDADPRSAEAVAAGLAALKAMRRAGFSSDLVAMKAPFAQAEGAFVTLSEALRGQREACDRLAKRLPMSGAFEDDRIFFARQFALAYLAPTEGSDDVDPQS